MSSTREPLVRRASRELLAERVRADEAAVLLAEREDCARRLARLCRTVDPLAVPDVALVAAGPTGDGSSAALGAGGDGPSPATVERIARPTAPAATVGAVESAIDALSGRGRTHVLVDGWAGLGDAAPPEAVYNRCRELTLTGGARNGLAVVGLGTVDLSGTTVESLSHLFDIHVRLREAEGGPQARWTAVTAGTDGWQPWQPVEVPPGGSG